MTRRRDDRKRNERLNYWADALSARPIEMLEQYKRGEITFDALCVNLPGWLNVEAVPDDNVPA